MADTSSKSQSIITPEVDYQFGNGIKGDCIDVALYTNTRKTGVIDSSTEASGTNKLDGLVAQTVTGSIQKQPRQFYEVGSNKYYFVEARPSGSGSIDHVLGPNTCKVWDFLSEFANVCNSTDLVVGKHTGCACDTGNEFDGYAAFRSGILNSFQVTATANDWVLTSRLGFTFYDLTTQNSMSSNSGQQQQQQQQQPQ